MIDGSFYMRERMDAFDSRPRKCKVPDKSDSRKCCDEEGAPDVEDSRYEQRIVNEE
jgi:hypothetical protein